MFVQSDKENELIIHLNTIVKFTLTYFTDKCDLFILILNTDKHTHSRAFTRINDQKYRAENSQSHVRQNVKFKMR